MRTKTWFKEQGDYRKGRKGQMEIQMYDLRTYVTELVQGLEGRSVSESVSFTRTIWHETLIIANQVISRLEVLR